MPSVLDACAVIAFLRDEPGAEVVERFLAKEPPDCMVHAINLCEVYYDFLRVSGEDSAIWAIAVVRSIGLIVREDMDEAFWQQAGRFKVAHRLPLADAFALSLADRFAANLLTSDRGDFTRVAEAGACRILFIR